MSVTTIHITLCKNAGFVIPVLFFVSSEVIQLLFLYDKITVKGGVATVINSTLIMEDFYACVFFS